MSFPRYPKYKESGVEWLGEVPEHWETSRLGFESWVRARLGWKGLKAEEYVDDGFAFLSTPNIKGTDIDFENVNFIDQHRFDESPEIKLSAGDVLLAKDGSTLGTVNIVRSLPRPTTVNSSIAVISPKPRLCGVYLYRLFESSYMEHTIQRIKGGMGVPHLFQADLNKFYLPIPPRSEQSLIAAFLDRETVKIDELVAEQRRLIELLKEKRQAVISHAVTKGLNPHAPMKPSGIEWLGDVPGHWSVTRLSWICTDINDINHEMPAAVESGVPFLSAKDLLDDGTLNFTSDIKLISEQDFEKLSRKILPRRGDIIYSRIGACLGKARLVETDQKFLISYSCCVVRVRQAVACREFIRQLLDGEMILTEARMRTQGIGVPDLGLREIGRFPIPLPPLNEQVEISRFINAEVDKLQSLTVEAERAVDLLQERRTALISAAVTGKIDVRWLNSPEL